MKFVYSKWTALSTTAEQRLENLFKMFFALVLRVNGDIEEALEWMKYLDEKYDLLGGNMTMEQFIDALKQRGLISEDDNTKTLTPSGVQRIRTDALKEIF